MKYVLYSIPQINMSAINLELPPPNGINNGGFQLPIGQAYSQIDLIVASLLLIDQTKFSLLYCQNLRNLFLSNPYRECEEKIHLGILSEDNDIIVWSDYISIYKIKCTIKTRKDTDLLSIMKKNAPLTFGDTHA